MPPSARSHISPGAKKTQVLLLGLDGNNYVNLAMGFLKAYADVTLGKTADIRIEELPGGLGAGLQNKVLKELLSTRPQILGLSCGLWNIRRVMRIAAIFRKKLPSIKIIIGGTHTSNCAPRLIRNNRFDAVVIGEGEATFRELLERQVNNQSWEGTLGAYVKVSGKITYAGVRPPIADLNTIPSPYLTGILKPGKNSVVPLQTTRGCQRNCSFCSLEKGGRVRYFPESRVKKEIKWLTGREVCEVEIIDSELFENKQRGLMVLKLISQYSRTPRPIWVCDTNVDIIDEDIALALNSNKLQFSLGIQSLNPLALKNARRPHDLKRIVHKMDLLKRLAPECRLRLLAIFGLPGDNFERCMQTLEWLLNQASGNIKWFIFRLLVLPGTGIAKGKKLWEIKHRADPPYRLISIKDLSRTDLDRALYTANAACSTLHLSAAPEIFRELSGGTIRVKDVRQFIELAESRKSGIWKKKVTVVNARIKLPKKTQLFLLDTLKYFVYTNRHRLPSHSSFLQRINSAQAKLLGPRTPKTPSSRMQH